MQRSPTVNGGTQDTTHTHMILQETSKRQTFTNHQEVAESTTVTFKFGAEAKHSVPYDYPPDTHIRAKEESKIIYHVHRRCLLDRSKNAFNSLLTTGGGGVQQENKSSHMGDARVQTTITLDERPEVIVALLHLKYELSVRYLDLSIDTISNVFTALTKYGYTLDEVVTPSSELFTDLVLQAKQEPLQLYSFAAFHSFEGLAVPVSEKAVEIFIPQLDEESAVRIGATYLHRLLLLQETRRAALKRLMFVPLIIPNHADTASCAPHDRHDLQQRFVITIGNRVWEAAATIAGPDWITGVFEGLARDVRCGACRWNLRERKEAVLREWNDVKSTI
ncbi:uncharacterized protein EI90DRAFT_3122704 [Cantharellus anzutake]|uniref:uncharacterized protein n=1 Tax=Cantharellus anzutake TaxID=1750568 RepID=UPI0019060B99|nr:uncharacterized protein EI90DRAFT_3122704 [Cantharellus anzutake]KAF8332263.1 hypothetical protein EI90DRAFT_3122704 [Cantharellus anzutake]